MEQNMLLWYSSLFSRLYKWCFGTALAQFFLFLFLFLGVTYLSTLIEIDYHKQFISEYQKNIVLASSLYMVVPFAHSTICLFGLLHKNPRVLKIFMICSLINATVILLAVIGSGIYLAVKGTDYIAYSLIVFGLVLELFLAHGILLVYGVRESYLEASKRNSNGSENIEEL